jgi:hypothetical protein
MIKIKCCICGKKIVNPLMQQKTCSRECRLAYPKSEAMKKYRQENRERIRATQNAYNKTPTCKRIQKDYYIRNRVEITRRAKEKYANKKQMPKLP